MTQSGWQPSETRWRGRVGGAILYVVTCVLAVDQGTSGTKAIVVDESGAVLVAGRGTPPPALPRGRRGRAGPGGALRLRRRGRTSRGRRGGGGRRRGGAGQPGRDRAGVGPGSGRPLSPAIVWQDRRAEPVCRARAEHAARVAELTGLVLDPYFSAPKLRWLRDQVTTDGVVTTTDTWLVHRLCGAFVTDTSTASRSLLLDLDTATWSDELLGVFGLGGRGAAARRRQRRGRG